MLPYRAPELKIKKQSKSKPIPSLQLIHTLNQLCENSENTYDSKNHILTIVDISNFQFSAHQKFNRTLYSMERQLKMLGFKCRRFDKQYVKAQENHDPSQKQNNEVRIYRWKGKKQLLIDQQLNLIQKGLKQRRAEIQETRQQVKAFKKNIDNQIQSIIFSILVNSNPKNSKISEFVNNLLEKTKLSVNDAELNIRKIVNLISMTLANELQLYKLLIYKEGITQKRLQQRQGQAYGEGEAELEPEAYDEGDGYDDQNQHSYDSLADQNAIQEQSKGSMVSIEVDKQIKREIKQENIQK